VPVDGLYCDILWSDPDLETTGWGNNDRGVSYTFGADIIEKFLDRHDLDLICRAHQSIGGGRRLRVHGGPEIGDGVLGAQLLRRIRQRRRNDDRQRGLALLLSDSSPVGIEAEKKMNRDLEELERVIVSLNRNEPSQVSIGTGHRKCYC